MTDLALRAQKLLDELDNWFVGEQVTPPPYVSRQIESLKAELKKGDSND